jgi:hypothetical protein
MPKKFTEKNKKRFMEDSLDWLRKNVPDVDKNLDNPTVEAVTNLAGHALPPGIIPRVAKKKALEDSLDWLRNNDPNVGNLDDPTMEALSQLTGMPLPKKSTLKDKLLFAKLEAKDFLRDWVDYGVTGIFSLSFRLELVTQSPGRMNSQRVYLITCRLAEHGEGNYNRYVGFFPRKACTISKKSADTGKIEVLPRSFYSDVLESSHFGIQRNVVPLSQLRF